MKNLILAFVLVLNFWTSQCLAGWPSLPYPENARVETIGDQMRLNGVSMRMHRILSGQDVEQTLNFYKKALGAKFAEAEFYGAHILSQERAGYFITIKINRLNASLTEILLSISDGRTPKSAAGLAIGLALPSDSELLSDMESVDAGINSRQIIFNNAHSMQANADFIAKVLHGKGYALQPKMSVKNANSISLTFEGNKREARLVVLHNEDGSSAVLTTILGQ